MCMYMCLFCVVVAACCCYCYCCWKIRLKYDNEKKKQKETTKYYTQYRNVYWRLGPTPTSWHLVFVKQHKRQVVDVLVLHFQFFLPLALSVYTYFGWWYGERLPSRWCFQYQFCVEYFLYIRSRVSCNPHNTKAHNVYRLYRFA